MQQNISEKDAEKGDLQNGPTNEKLNRGYWFYIVFLITIFLAPFFFNYSQTEEITWQQFQNNILSRKAVQKLEVINSERVDVYLKEKFAKDKAFEKAFNNSLGDKPNPGPHYHFSIGSIESFDRQLEEAEINFKPNERIDVRYIHESNWLASPFSWLLPFILIFIFWQYLFRKFNAGADNPSFFSFGKSTATLFDKENKSTITFDDVAGLEEAKIEVKEIVNFLKDPGAYTKLGAKIPKGVIIVGPPGTGKTLLVKAVAGEAKVPFFSISGSEFVEMFVGVGASRVRDLFKRAKEKAPSIVFIDEIDAVGRLRSKNTIFSGANDERESTLNQLLTEMDGFGTNSGVIVLAATNRADMLDPALLRPGRFDRHIYLELPDSSERLAIFKVHLRALVLGKSIDVTFLASQTAGFSGADIANICNEAALIAARSRKDAVDRQDFMEAIDRVVAGLERKSKVLSAKEKLTIAYHEGGHAIVSWLLKHVDPLTKVSIIPRGKSLGAAWYLPEERQLRTSTEFFERICAALGGRAAEELMIGEVSSGALDDLEKVTKDAYMMVAYYGFNSIVGHTSFFDSTGARENALQKPYSEETARIIDEEVRKLIEKAYDKASEILKQHKAQLTLIAKFLLEKEVIFKEDLQRILGEREVDNQGIQITASA